MDKERKLEGGPCSECGEYVGPGEWHECGYRGGTMEMIKPCPFCGGKGRVMIPKGKFIGKYNIQITCVNHLCPMGEVKTYVEYNKDIAIKAWNTRS